MKKLNEKGIVKIIEDDPWMIRVLKAAESLNLPDWWIGGGFIRSKVWDHLHGFEKRTDLPDVDIIYFDKNDFSRSEANKFSTRAEDKYQEKLNNLIPEVKWSVTNQARMHNYHKRKPYKNSGEALSEWSETATCVAVQIRDGKLTFLAPYGIKDLVDLNVRPIPEYKRIFAFDPGVFERRLNEKKWKEKWPKLRIAY